MGTKQTNTESKSGIPIPQLEECIGNDFKEVKEVNKSMKPYEELYIEELYVEEPDIIDLSEWRISLMNGWFGPDDGSGYWMVNGVETKLDVFTVNKPVNATGVIWYNK